MLNGFHQSIYIILHENYLKYSNLSKLKFKKIYIQCTTWEPAAQDFKLDKQQLSLADDANQNTHDIFYLFQLLGKYGWNIADTA